MPTHLISSNAQIVYIKITLFNSLESGMNQRCTDPPALRHDVMRSVKMEERKWSGLQDYSVACRSLAARLDTLSNCASLVTCDKQNRIITKYNL